MATSIDPVCKMKVDESKPAAVSEYKDKKYYFCAVGCKKSFDKNPEKYLAPGGGSCCGTDNKCC